MLEILSKLKYDFSLSQSRTINECMIVHNSHEKDKLIIVSTGCPGPSRLTCIGAGALSPLYSLPAHSYSCFDLEILSHVGRFY